MTNFCCVLFWFCFTKVFKQYLNCAQASAVVYPQREREEKDTVWPRKTLLFDKRIHLVNK